MKYPEDIEEFYLRIKLVKLENGFFLFLSVSIVFMAQNIDFIYLLFYFLNPLIWECWAYLTMGDQGVERKTTFLCSSTSWILI